MAIMLHPDSQYTPRLTVAMASSVAPVQHDVVPRSRTHSRAAVSA